MAGGGDRTAEKKAKWELEAIGTEGVRRDGERRIRLEIVQKQIA